MDEMIYTYALIKSLYDLEEDYIECFLPFVIKAFSNEEGLNSSLIQKKVKEKSNLFIPIHPLNTILYQAQKRDFINKDYKTYNITNEGLNYLHKFEDEGDVKRRIGSLIEDMKIFFVNNGNELTYNEIQELICTFINKNFKMLIDFLNPSISAKIRSKKLEGCENILLEYIEVAEKKKPEYYDTLKDMILGSLISVSIYTKKASELNKIKDNWFKCQIFFDTNFIFSLLNLHTPNFNDPAQELFKLLKKNEFELKVFDFTANEINSVMNGYINELNRYPESIKVNSLYSNLKRKGWAKSDIIKFTADLDNTLMDIGIEIETTDVNLDTYEPKDKKFISKLENYKQFQHVRGQFHDLAAIDIIKKIRKKTIRKFEESNALFLTSDIQLSKFNLIEMNHKDQNTISEVILDKTLTNIIWLKDPNADISLKAIIESYSQDLFVNKRVWNKFFNVLQELKIDKKVNAEDVSMLFYHGQIESTLIGLNDNNVEDITQDFILKEVDNAEKLQKEDIELMEKKESSFLKQLENQTERHNTKIMEIKENLKLAAENESNRNASILSKTIMISLFLVGIGVLIKIYTILNTTGNATILIVLIGFSALFVTFSGVPKYQEGAYLKLNSWIKNWMFNKSYKTKLDEAKLSED